MKIELKKDSLAAVRPPKNSFRLGELWPDNNGTRINAHVGGFLFHDETYFWFGEHKVEGEAGNFAHVGVHVYSSRDLSIFGNWAELGNPFLGAGEQIATTFNSQSTFILPMRQKPDAFVFMADRWNPQNAIDGRYVWLAAHSAACLELCDSILSHAA